MSVCTVADRPMAMVNRLAGFLESLWLRHWTAGVCALLMLLTPACSIEARLDGTYEVMRVRRVILTAGLRDTSARRAFEMLKAEHMEAMLVTNDCCEVSVPSWEVDRAKRILKADPEFAAVLAEREKQWTLIMSFGRDQGGAVLMARAMELLKAHGIQHSVACSLGCDMIVPDSEIERAGTLLLADPELGPKYTRTVEAQRKVVVVSGPPSLVHVARKVLSEAGIHVEVVPRDEEWDVVILKFQVPYARELLSQSGVQLR